MSQMNENEIKEAKNEARVHKMVMHPNIIKLIDTYTTNKQKLIMILEYAEKADLQAEIDRRKDKGL